MSGAKEAPRNVNLIMDKIEVPVLSLLLPTFFLFTRMKDDFVHRKKKARKMPLRSVMEQGNRQFPFTIESRTSKSFYFFYAFLIERNFSTDAFLSLIC